MCSSLGLVMTVWSKLHVTGFYGTPKLHNRALSCMKGVKTFSQKSQNKCLDISSLSNGISN